MNDSRADVAAARSAADHFAFYGDLLAVRPYGTGHINGSFVVLTDQAGRRVRYLLQRVNTYVFTEPEALMDNVVRVTEHIRRRLASGGATVLSRRTLTVVPARDGRPFWRGGDSSFWRAYLFIEGASSSELMDSPGRAAALGEAVGRFQELLSDLPGPRLAETIPNFHNARTRYATFEKAVAEDRVGRVALAEREIDFFRANREGFDRIVTALESGAIPERITHNDTKIQNLLLDDRTGEAICVIDLDTVMPGSAAYDFGDLARTVPASVAEDEEDASGMFLDLSMYEALVRGYAGGTAQSGGGSSFLTPAEIALLPTGARVITMLMGIRFLTDWLDGDRYYRVARESHNLDRCRTQIALVRSMDENWNEMRETTEVAFAALKKEGTGWA
jgi:Ser/Thr protein kinase RdoA (MazF antagonist)